MPARVRAWRVAPCWALPMACRAIVSQWVTAITQSSQHSPCTWLACPSTEAASPSCMDGAPCPDTAQVTTPWPARTREAWPGLSVPRHPQGRLRLRLTRGRGLVAEALGPQPLGPVQAHTEPGPVQAVCCDWLPGPAMDALGRPPGVGGSRGPVSLSGPSISRRVLLDVRIWTRLWPGSWSPACPKAVAVAKRAHEIQWA